MCFFNQHRFVCGDWKWGHFQRHCSREYRIGETCGMKLIEKTVPVAAKCKLCEKIDTKMMRRATEVSRINRQQREGKKFQASLNKSNDLIKLYDSQIYELNCERNRRLRDIGALGVPQTNEEKQRFQALHHAISSDMGNAQCPTIKESHDQKLAAGVAQLNLNSTAKQRVLGFNTMAARSKLPYLELDFSSRQIRLFQLNPRTEAADIQGSFRCVELTECPTYTALSYTWGDTAGIQQIAVGEAGTIDVRKNLWEFLHQQSLAISEPKLFWIDAICINQSNVHERNHQVKLMKQIYVRASEVYLWLGREADNSDLAMHYIAKKGTQKPRPRGLGFRPIWTRVEGRALYHLCERRYWRRMWIIQEIVHAEKITVWCGAKCFEWGILERLYVTLKTLDDTHWIAHHEFAIKVLQSSAAVIVWQRAYWRHPQTPTPTLQTLIEVFGDWQCTDIRDKVFALVSMASPDTAVIPDYSQSALQVYLTVQAGSRFNIMLSRLLRLSTFGD